MALSNTATPRYYGEFREAVLNGEIPVNNEISMQMNIIDELIRDPNYYYDPAPVEGYIKYSENELTLVDGGDLRLLDYFKLWAEDLYGWYYFVERSVFVPDPDNHGGHYEQKRIKKRLRNKQILIVGRGAAKSLYMSTNQSYIQNIDRRTTQGIVTAPTMKQAEEIVSPIRTAIARSKGPLFKFLTFGSLQNTTGSTKNQKKLSSTKEGIINKLTNSTIEVRPMSIDRLQGLRPSISTIDEWLSGDTREDPIEALEQGAAKNEDYIIIAASSEGTIRNGPGDNIKMECMKILRGEWPNPRVSIWWYKLDSLDELNHPEKWRKANPALGKIIPYDVYQAAYEKAVNVPSSRNDILAKRFGMPMEGYTYFFTYEETIPHRKQDFWKMPCSLGMDASQGDDFWSFTFWFPLGDGSFGIKTRNYINSVVFSKLPLVLHEKYEEFIQEGSLCVIEGAVLDTDEVYDNLWRYIIDKEYQVCSFGYDPYNAKEFVKRWVEENGAYGVEVVKQGSKTESVPLGEMKTLAEERMLIFDESIFSYAMGNCITIEDNNGNIKLYKKRRDQKIDPVAACMDAYVAYKANKDIFG